MNYLKIFEDGTSEAVDVKPSWGMYEKEHALDNREVYIDGNWYSTTGGELVTNGTFDTDTVGWTGSGTFTSVSGMGKLVAVTQYPTASQTIPILGLVTLNAGMVDGNVECFYDITVDGTSTRYRTSIYGNSISVQLIIESTLSIRFGHYSATAGDFAYADNISVYKTQPTIDTLQPPHTYLSNKGKLAGIEVANGVPVDIHYDELAPTLVEDTIKTNNLVVTDSFDLGQKLVDVTSERVAGVTYTNDTGKPIQLNIHLIGNTTLAYTTLYIDGVYMGYYGAGSSASASVYLGLFINTVIPDGSTYYITNTGTQTLQKWSELR